MADKKTQTRAGGAPPLDYFDLSYVTPLLTAHTLQEQAFTPFHMGGALRAASAVSQRSGHLARRLVFEKFYKTFVTDLETATQNRSAVVANWFVSQYKPRPYPYIILGPPLGSMSYLSCVLDAPFLPLNYRMFIAHDKPMEPDAASEHSKRARAVAETLFKRDPDVELVFEYDPVHERLRTRNGVLMRFKYLDLPRSYMQFIRTYLAPGGSIILIESRTGWSQYRLAEKLYMQVGQFGGITDAEFLGGSKRMGEFRERYMGDDRASYRLPIRPDVAPESRFGVSPNLRAAIMRATEQLNRPICQLFTGDIYQLNNLTSNLYLRCARREGRRPSRFFVHSGLFISPLECMNSMLLPLWVPDSSFPSFQFAQQFLQSYPFESEQVLLALEPQVTGPPDAQPFDKWVEMASSRGQVRVIGSSPRVFPYDLTTYFSFWKAIQGFSRRLKDPLDIRVTLDMLIEEAEKCRIYFTMYQR